MAEKTSFPMLSNRSWWALRRKFKQAVPKQVNSEYLSLVLGMSEPSAKTNVLPYLKTAGLIDEEGKTTELANKWRFDDTYQESCKDILTRIYPQELRDAIQNPAENRVAVDTWFANKNKTGRVAAQMMSSFYILLSEADPSKGEKSTTPKVGEKKAKVSKELTPKAKIESKEEEAEEIPPKAQQESRVAGIPSIHIDLQIHLSPEATADQIDQIFASMAKHLKDLYQPHK